MPKFDDYWFDEYDGRPPHEDGHRGEPHDHPYDDYPHDHHPHPPFDGRRHRPVDMGKVDTTKMHDRYDMFVPHHMPPWGFKFPKLEKAFVPGSTPQEQVAYLLNRVDTMIDYFNHYDDKVWGAYNAVVHSALGNEAYYREITREEGYLADGSTPYTVIHIPYLDRADRPIFLELGLAYNNTTNNGVKENVFEASQNRVADKLIPAFNIADGWAGKAMLKGAPIQSTYTEGKFTLAVTDNGFLKIYPNTVSYDQLNRDRIRNAMGAQGVLINNGAKTPEQYATNGGELLARVGIGMNYETKERLIVIVNGNPTPPNDASVTGATADMLADIFARYNCTVAVETANNGSAVAMDKGQMIYMPDTATTGVIPTVPSINCYWYITKRRHYHNQYVKDVADLIQKVGQNKWRCEIALQSCDFLKGRVNELQRDLDAEVQARQDADEQLQNNIDAEAEARRLADEQLQDNIDAEAETRRLADVQLQDNIDAETNARVAGDNALDERITGEVSILNARIDAVVADFNNAIAVERQARIDGDNALGTRIDNEVATISARIDTEVATLNALIDAEEQARIAEDTALQNSLTQLREDYTAFLTTYANDLAETRRITTALRSDISTIQGQIAELQSNLSAVNASITAILATINTIEQSFENIKTAFTELQEDWHDYKDSVDAEIAQLMQDIAELNSQTHDVVADMKADTNLKAGMYVLTGGYYAVNDGGGSLYRICSTAPSTYYETLLNGLYAELIYGEIVSPEQFGAYGDGTHDDTQPIQTAINNADGKIVVFKKTYKISQSLTLPSETHLEGAKGAKIYSSTECVFSGDMRKIFVSHITFENIYEQYENGVRLGRVFDTIALSNISKNTFINFYSVFESISECTSFDGNICLYLGQRLGLGATDSYISQNYISGSQFNSGKTIMLRFLNNSSFNNNFVDYFNTCFRFQAGNRSSQITGNTFDDCMAVFRDFMEGVTVTGNTFSNIKYVAENWNTQPSAELINKPWGIIIYDWSTTDMADSTDTKQLGSIVFSDNLFRNCDYYIWIDGSVASRAVYLGGQCQFRGNAGSNVNVFAGFLVTQTVLDSGKMYDVYFDFWDGRTFANLPRPALTSSSGATNSRVESYQHMKCFVNGEEYINMGGAWKKYTMV